MGALPSKRSPPEKLFSGTFHEVLDAYAEDIRTTAMKPGTDVLTPYGRQRLAHVSGGMDVVTGQRVVVLTLRPITGSGWGHVNNRFTPKTPARCSTG